MKKICKTGLRCVKLIPMLEDNQIQQNLFFSDEATFYLNGLVNNITPYIGLTRIYILLLKQL